MALTIKKKKYAEIKAGVERHRLEAEIEKIMAEPGAVTFKTVDEFLNHLDEQSPDRPARSPKEVR